MYADPDRQRAFQRRHYAANKLVYLARAKAGRSRTRAAVTAWLLEYLKSHPCIDCGERDPIVLEFDHRDGTVKRFEIGSARRRSNALQAVIDEVSKCDVRCANCHRRRTYKARGFTHRG
jgi:hypothetical protein